MMTDSEIYIHGLELTFVTLAENMSKNTQA